MIEYYDKEELELQISNYLSGNSTDEEKETLLAFLASNEAAARTFREMSAVDHPLAGTGHTGRSRTVTAHHPEICGNQKHPGSLSGPSGHRRSIRSHTRKSDGSIYQRRFSLRNQGSCRIKNEYRSS